MIRSRRPKRRAAAIDPGRPTISYAGNPFSWQQGVAAGNNDPTAGGGTLASYALVGGSLPTGVTLNTATGRISGTPDATGTEDQSGVALICAYGPGGTSTATVVWTVAVEAPSFSYAGNPFSWPVDVEIDPAVAPTLDSGDPIVSYAVQAGALPVGVTLDPDTGELSGTPTVEDNGTATIRGTNSGGHHDEVVTWEITA